MRRCSGRSSARSATGRSRSSLVTPQVEQIGLRAWSALPVAVEAGRVAAIEALEAGGADTLRAALDAPA